jgi:EAL domain-containing protein (putative c-di-GMP-specific phosphodiesterase class I)
MEIISESLPPMYAELHTLLTQLGIRQSWIDRVNFAISTNQLTLDWQKIVPINCKSSSEFHEVCVRIIEEHGLITAGKFIEAIATDREVSLKLDRWVIQQVFDALQSGIHSGRVAINLSAASLEDGTLTDFLIEQFARTGIKPNQIVMEVTEHQPFNIPVVRDNLSRMAAIGCHAALDDFGKGYSGFEMLELPATFLKIDLRTTQCLMDNPDCFTAAKVLFFLAHHKGLEVIVEGMFEGCREQILQLAEEYSVTVWGQGWDFN